MAMSAQPLLRKRALGAVLAGIGALSLLALPVVGLMRIDDTTSESHRYTNIVAGADTLGVTLLQLVIGPLARYGADPSDQTRAPAVAALTSARDQLNSLAVEAEAAKRLDIGGALETYTEKARLAVELCETFLAEIDGGATTETASSTEATVAATTDLLAAQGQFALAVGPVRQELDEARRESLREAQWLLVVAAVVAAAVLGGLLLLDARRITSLFSRQEARRETAERMAAHRGDVVNMASHELRSPLTVLTLSTDLLRSTAGGRQDAEMAGLAEDAHTAALRCEALVSELLDLGRIDADRLQLRLGATPLMPALNDVVVLSEARHGSHPLLISGADEVRVNADPERLRIILRNLIDNAFKYSPPGSDVHVEVEEWEGRVRIDVRDEGSGIPEGQRERVFQRFERLSATEHLPGVGIGLYLSRELARRMDGELTCAPSTDGATFQLELPQAG
jgi:signal transduction histidine kinase